MARKTKPIRSDIAWSTPDRIEVHGKSLPDEILGHINLGDMAFLQIVGRMPTPQESNVFNAIAVTLVEHGITPSALVARLTYAGAPESLQAAVAAGLCGLGSVFVGSTEGTARMLYEALPPGTKGADLERIARETVSAFRERGQIIPGLGHPLHKPVDPRAPRLFQIGALGARRKCLVQHFGGAFGAADEHAAQAAQAGRHRRLQRFGRTGVGQTRGQCARRDAVLDQRHRNGVEHV